MKFSEDFIYYAQIYYYKVLINFLVRNRLWRNRYIFCIRYTLNSKPGKENTKERGELEIKIGFIVKAGSLTDLTRKERHKSSLGQLSSAAQSIGGSLLSIGSLEKRKGLKKLAKSIGNRVKGRSKNRLDSNNLDEKDEKDEYQSRITGQELGEADPGVISEDEDEFTVSSDNILYIFLLYFIIFDS